MTRNSFNPRDFFFLISLIIRVQFPIFFLFFLFCVHLFLKLNIELHGYAVQVTIRRKKKKKKETLLEIEFNFSRNPFNTFISQEFGSLIQRTALQRVLRLSNVATRRFREETFPSSLCLEKSRRLQDRYVHDWAEVYSRRKSQLCNSCKRASRNSLSIEIFLSLSVVVCATLNAISQLKRHI